jgi:hypothetical protein
MKDSIQKAIEKMEQLGSYGLTVSVAYGNIPPIGMKYSVNVMSIEGHTFPYPIVTNSFYDSIMMAEVKCVELNWIPS